MSGCGMSERPETSADIIAEMNRVEVCADGEPCLRDYADRLDAAHKREVDELNEQIADLRQQRDLWSKRAAELVAKCNEQYAKLKQVGNAAKLREALVQVQKKIKYLIGNLTVPNSLVASRMEVNGIINAALAAPPRNCDVGTVEEQLARFIAFCKGQRLHSSGHADTCNPKCPCRDGGDINLCALTWAQMPYESEEGGDR